MKTPNCLKCELKLNFGSKVERHGRFYRTSDSRWIQRFRCTVCRATSSAATFDLRYRQKKRRKNNRIRKLLCSGVSQRRAAKLEQVNRKTVVRIFKIEALKAEFNFRARNIDRGRAKLLQFDDLETFEQTKCKPISVTLAVEEKTRRILGVEVSRMAANGRLADKAKALYGLRPDERRSGRERLFDRMSPFVEPHAVLKSDDNPHYPASVRSAFPHAAHVTYKGKRGASTGQGELKKVRFDPLFSLNHTCAMFRANVNRLFRKTWCTTKRIEGLYMHLVLYADYHNQHLIPWPGVE